ncbi:hypothetical protein SAMN05443270_3059 [Lacrimispora sphenoides]|uniref:DUF2786 domain-containing protein n=1 Tax=Lacrimispora sphenoides TaxID=29370 RepID=UPI0008AC9C66|nr:DUF2786 domain-containing protein [Lacrimispora sphenoides]SEU09053.1 hypothetical protein SAMN05443270_3059 [Lacrimispora sphenoides]
MSNYYNYREVKVMIAHRLMALDGWKVYDYSPDQSDSMTDYYCPATWGGVAEKNGYVLCVDVYGAREPQEIRKYNHTDFSYDRNIADKIKKLEAMTVERGASEAEAESAIVMIERLQKKSEAATENKEKYVVVGMIPGHQAHPNKCNWHIEKDGIIIAKGNGILKYSEVDSYFSHENYTKDMQNFKKQSKDEYIKKNVDDLIYHRYYSDIEKATKSAESHYDDMINKSKLVDQFNTFINKLDTTCGGLLGEGDGTIYEKVIVTEYKNETKAVEVETGEIKEGQCFILKTSFMYGKYKGLVYRIHERKTENGSYFYAYKLNGKLTKECTGSASSNNKWGSFGERFLKWIETGAISWCELKEVKTPYEVEKVVKKSIGNSKVETKKKETATTTSEGEEQRVTISTTYTYDISEDIDTRDNSNIWVVKVKESLSREEYKQLNQSMNDIGGYYSRFKHGFIFKENPEVLLNVETVAKADDPTESNQEEKKGPEKQKPAIEYDITEDKSPSGKINYLLKIKNELSKDDFSEVKRKFAKIQGYHSSQKDGFIFKYNPAEKLII